MFLSDTEIPGLGKQLLPSRGFTEYLIGKTKYFSTFPRDSRGKQGSGLDAQNLAEGVQNRVLTDGDNAVPAEQLRVASGDNHGAVPDNADNNGFIGKL